MSNLYLSSWDDCFSEHLTPEPVYRAILHTHLIFLITIILTIQLVDDIEFPYSQNYALQHLSANRELELQS